MSGRGKETAVEDAGKKAAGKKASGGNAAGKKASGGNAAGKKSTICNAGGAAGAAGGSANETIGPLIYLPNKDIGKHLPNSRRMLAILMGNHGRLGQESPIWKLDDPILYLICGYVGKSRGLECLDVLVCCLKNGEINLRDFEQLASLRIFIDKLEELGIVSCTEDGEFFKMYDPRNTKSVLGINRMKIINPQQNMEQYIEALKNMFNTQKTHTWTMSAKWSTEKIRTVDEDFHVLVMCAATVMRFKANLTNFEHATIPKRYRNKPLYGHLQHMDLDFGSYKRFGGQFFNADDDKFDKLLSFPFDKLENGQMLMRMYQEYCCSPGLLEKK